MSDREIRYEVADGIATITLNRPEKLNALTAAMGRQLREAFDTTDADDAVRAVVLTGAGRAFCAGADLARGASTFDAGSEGHPGSAPDAETVDGVPRDGGGVLALRVAASLKPVIVAVNGPAVGLGATMTLPADIRIAADSARFGFVFTRRGLVPEAASSWFLPRIVGISQAMEWVATGRVFNAQEALTGGLISRVEPADGLLDAAYGIAREIVENTSAVSVTLSRRMLWSMLGADGPWDAHRMDSRAIYRLGGGDEAAEGVLSFLEKRPPRFPGRIDEYRDVLPDWPQRPECD
ncbi:crotonase/enoyl-CoA hydratase family protein [Nocardiopsis valliformis]|uniref:crotonase/enoyl-CoA hydratase family protein n=1 Tax=Nocardiopsis valliformis TaxID=239974 RepID=UPI00034AF3B9|nr:crotonase/enoyl-CoA hydratase family protein [Nocardiopsis valliformis]